MQAPVGNKIMQARVGNLKLYKFDVPYESDVGVVLMTFSATVQLGFRFSLTRFTASGGSRSKAGLSKSFVNWVSDCFGRRETSNVSGQIFDYIVSNFSFKELKIVPPSCPVLVFHIQTRNFGQDHVRDMDMASFTRVVLSILRTRDSILSSEDALTRPVAIVPPTTKIVDCYQSSGLCSLCEKGYPKEDEIVHKTRCNHIFHGTCISRFLLHTPQCPVCSADLPPVDIRTLLFL